MLVYSPGTAGIELTGLACIWIVNIVKYKIGSTGNKTETSFFVLFFLILSFFSIYSFLYFGFMQTYCLLIEVIINSIGIGLNLIEIFGAIIAFSSIHSSEISL